MKDKNENEGELRSPDVCPEDFTRTCSKFANTLFAEVSFGVEPNTPVSGTDALGLCGHSSTPQGYTPIGEAEVINPSEMIAIGDSFSGTLTLFRADLKYLESRGFASSRHQGKANVLFCDGHVGSPTLQFLFADISDEALSRWNRDHQPHREKLSP